MTLSNVHRAPIVVLTGIPVSNDFNAVVFMLVTWCRYLLKLMTGTNLPTTEKEFTDQLKIYFPKVWDMKYVMSKKNLHGGLQKVSLELLPLIFHVYCELPAIASGPSIPQPTVVLRIGIRHAFMQQARRLWPWMITACLESI